ncbi:PQQ-dependent sugar dehydrogenase [Desulfatiglans anilini]|uniref:PQQ-dependent sugar dehydrogenase n=1 Tax=Desulfatiglans anilini TaxID=90728 RepID=UPI00041E95FF
MRRSKKATCILILISAALFLQCTLAIPEGDIDLERINLPEGFKIHIYARDVPGARSMAKGTKNVVFVGSRDPGNVYALVDHDGDGQSDAKYVLASDLSSPNGVAFRNNSLYVAEISRVIRFDDIMERLADPPAPVVVNDDFPSEPHHGWKYIAFGPDGKLYVPVGAPCNVCLEEDPRFATIMRMNADGSGLEIFAEGIRNTVGFDWHPVSGVLWFTDNGRDWMGDDRPPDVLARAPRPGMHFGFPFCHAGYLPDPEFGERRSCSEFAKPSFKLGPHVAALGMKFYTGQQFPKEFHNDIFIAEHGSWNRTVPIGYRITRVRLKGSQAVSYDVFADGWLQGAKAFGRPVDILILGDGSMLVSDDRAGVIYRIHYSP